MAFSLETDGFLLAFSRMVARRGKPKKVVSDNGTNLSGGEKQLRELLESLDQTKIMDSAANQDIDWKFNPPYGSHHGGVFESLIKSTKKTLYAVLGDTNLNKPTDEELLTAIVEVEGLLNSRPLMYCSSDPADEPVLTPNHFLQGQCGGPLAPQVVDETPFNPRRRWRWIQDLMAKFWKRWTKEYLQSLQLRAKWTNTTRDLVVGDVVVLQDQTLPRGTWPIARVTEVLKSQDDHVRTVKVKSRGKEYIRPITRLVPLVLVEKTEDQKDYQ